MKDRKASGKIKAGALLGALALVATALAGCTASATVTASQLQPTAGDHANDWDSGAELVMILGTAGTMQMQSMFGAYGMDSLESDAIDEAAAQEFWQRVKDDPEPGDGRAEFWVYVYRNGAGTAHLIVTVDKDRKVVYQQETQGSDLGHPIGEYSVDSDEAMRIALEANGHLAGAMEGDQFGFVISLVREDPRSNPVWLVAGGGGSTQGGGGGMVLIDARTGALLQNQGGGGGPGGWS